MGTPSWANRRVLFAAAAFVLGCVLALVILEVIVRLIAPEWLELRMRELNAGNAYRIGTDQEWPAELDQHGAFLQFKAGGRFMARHYEYQHEVTIDELGGRTVPYPPHYRVLIPFLGDSFLFGVGVQDTQAFLSLLSQRSDARLLNLGVPGSSLPDQVTMLTRRHAELGNPKTYVFCWFAGNDLMDILSLERKRSGEAETPPSAADSLLEELNAIVHHNWLLKQLYWIQYFRQAALNVLRPDRGRWMNPIFNVMDTERNDLTLAMRSMRRELQRLDEISRELDFKCLFVLIPDVNQLDDARRKQKAHYYGLDFAALDPWKPNRAVQALLDDLGIASFDLGPCMADKPSPEKLYYQADNHLTVQGNAAVMDCLMAGDFLGMISSPDGKSRRDSSRRRPGRWD